MNVQDVKKTVSQTSSLPRQYQFPYKSESVTFCALNNFFNNNNLEIMPRNPCLTWVATVLFI